MEFHVGTSGWMYDHWRGPFYPQQLAKKAWLDFYQRQFETVELNNSFYRLPSASAWDTWRETAMSGFVFSVKASRFISHFKRFKDPEDSLKLLFEGAERLREHLGPVLYQSRPDFERTPENVERIEKFLSLLPRFHQHVMEFRHDSWFTDEAIDQLRTHKVAFCSYDMPGVKCPLTATASFAYVRFHGSGEKYGGNYDDADLSSWAERLRALGRDLDSIWVYFNNDAHGYAPNNARRLRELLDC